MKKIIVTSALVMACSLALAEDPQVPDAGTDAFKGVTAESSNPNTPPMEEPLAVDEDGDGNVLDEELGAIAADEDGDGNVLDEELMAADEDGDGNVLDEELGIADDPGPDAVDTADTAAMEPIDRTPELEEQTVVEGAYNSQTPRTGISNIVEDDIEEDGVLDEVDPTVRPDQQVSEATDTVVPGAYEDKTLKSNVGEVVEDEENRNFDGADPVTGDTIDDDTVLPGSYQSKTDTIPD